jgi:hypothetical protein
MSLVLIHTQVLTLEDVMETAPSLMDLTSEDLDYQDVDDRGAMMVEDSKDEQKNIPPLFFLIRILLIQLLWLWQLRWWMSMLKVRMMPGIFLQCFIVISIPWMSIQLLM